MKWLVNYMYGAAELVEGSLAYVTGKVGIDDNEVINITRVPDIMEINKEESKEYYIYPMEEETK